HPPGAGGTILSRHCRSSVLADRHGDVPPRSRSQALGRMRDIQCEEATEMTCASARELIESYLDGELEAGLRTEVQDHLTGCSSCAEAHARLRELQTNIRTQAPYYETPADLKRRVQSALAQAAIVEHKTGGARPSGSWQWIAIAASLLLAVS